MVTGQAPVTLELRNTPGRNTHNPRWYTHISQLTQFVPPPETYKSEIGSQSTMCQVHAGAYVSLLTPGETNYSDCHPRKTTTYILHVVSITAHTHDRRKSIGENKQRKEKKIKERKEKKKKRNKTKNAREKNETKRKMQEKRRKMQEKRRKRQEKQEKTRQEEEASHCLLGQGSANTPNTRIRPGRDIYRPTTCSTSWKKQSA